MDLRISSGTYKNTRLKVAEETRPVKENVKLAIFSMLADKVIDASVLDLFAGSGNLGLESLSRGAKDCTFVEVNRFPVQTIKTNIEKINQNFQGTNIENRTTIVSKDALDFVSNEHEHYDVIFLDPPYESKNIHLLKNIFRIMDKDSILVYLHKTGLDLLPLLPDSSLSMKDSRKYGLTTVDFIELI